jgi:hypothetical protein
MGAVTGGCLAAAPSIVGVPCVACPRDGSALVADAVVLPSCAERLLLGAGLVPRDRGWVANIVRTMSWPGPCALFAIDSDGCASPSTRWRGSNDHPGGITTPSGRSGLPAGIAVPYPPPTCLVTTGACLACTRCWLCGIWICPCAGRWGKACIGPCCWCGKGGGPPWTTPEGTGCAGCCCN